MLPGVMQTGGKMGMRLMDDSLLELFNEGLITKDECYARCEQKAVMRQALLS
jgi:Tfp pilus assembly pilus retraction ATPase PilT